MNSYNKKHFSTSVINKIKINISIFIILKIENYEKNDKI